MKKTLLVALFGVCVLTTHAQRGRSTSIPDVYEVAYKPGFTVGVGCVASDTMGNWIVTGNFKDASAFFTQAYLMKTDSTGKKLWFITPVQPSFPNAEACEIRALLKTRDDNFLITGNVHICDVTSGGGFIQKISSSGNVLWSKYYPAPQNVWYIPFTCLTQLSSGRLCLGADSLAYFTKSNGDSIWAKSCQLGIVNSLTENHAHQLVFACKKGIAKMDTLGNVLKTIATTKAVESILQDKDSTYVIVSGGKILKLDSSFATSSSLNLSPYFASIAQLRISYGVYWLTGKDTLTGGLRVLALSPQLLFMHTSIYADAKVSGTDLAINAKQVAVAGIEHTNSSSNAFFKTFNDTLFGGHDSTDAGVTRVFIDSSYTIHPPSLPAGVNNVYFKARVTIKNYGNDTLHNVYLNIYIGPGGVCNQEDYYGLFLLTLAPGDTIQLSPGWLVSSGLYTSGSSYNMHECFWTSVPNGRVDKNHGNDSHCQNFVVPISVGINERSLRESVQVFPNPTHSEINVLLPDHSPKIYELKLYTVTGGLVKGIRYYTSHSLRLDVSEMPRGIYILEITDPEVPPKAFIRVVVY